MMFPEFVSRFNAYADTYRSASGSLPDAMRCKHQHTFDVVRYAHSIALQENFPEEDFFLAGLCALFHDIARFEQVKRFNTFNDKLSKFDHGYEAVRILLEQNMLKELSPAQRICVLAAVEFHNKLAIPDGICGEYALKFARLTRDADKLAILELVGRYLKGEIKVEDDSLIALSQNEGTDVSQEIIDSVLAGRPCPYGMIRNMNDFLTCLFVWVHDLNYPSSAAMVLENDFYGKLWKYLPKQAIFDQILELTNERLKCRCLK